MLTKPVVNVRKEPSFPERCVGGFLIENPTNSNEMFIATEHSKSLHIYCKKTSKFQKNVDDFNTIKEKIVQTIGPNINNSTKDWHLRSINAIQVTSKETIIMVGVCAVGGYDGTIPFYCGLLQNQRRLTRYYTIQWQILYHNYWRKSTQTNHSGFHTVDLTYTKIT